MNLSPPLDSLMALAARSRRHKEDRCDLGKRQHDRQDQVLDADNGHEALKNIGQLGLRRGHQFQVKGGWSEGGLVCHMEVPPSKSFQKDGGAWRRHRPKNHRSIHVDQYGIAVIKDDGGR